MPDFFVPGAGRVPVSAGCSEASERWNRCAAAGECLEWSGRVATGSWSVGARRRGEAVPGVGGVVRGVGTVGNMYAEVLRWLCLLCGRVSDNLLGKIHK